MKLTFVLLLLCGLAGAQSKTLGDKPWDFGVWVGGGFIRGNFEWSADVMPLYYVVQPGQNAYGAGFNPVNLKWNFTTHTRAVPYLELGGGVLFTNNNVPALTDTTNFLT